MVEHTVVVHSKAAEGEDWTSMFRIVKPDDTLLLDSEVSTIDLTIYDCGEQDYRQPENQVPVYEIDGILATDQVAHTMYTTRDVVTSTLRTEGWNGQGAGYQVIYVVTQSALSTANVTVRGGRVFHLAYTLHTTVCGDLRAEHFIHLGGIDL
jgi:hypothetical protein